ncbi:hypothetical protein [Alienimonas californiensis]|uniref:Uncharacterized protein n=1 Tax=Alienimonas californiensis TaxID=2527989 RepID=A0A517P9P7_9PLAN|nr:hypothetical protein [Alienimonas californiensis]QDT16103.1 hypothetical protein CA12_22010 [Alienimonas californiensis]
MHAPPAVPPDTDHPVPSPAAAASAAASTLKTRLSRWAASLFIGGYLSVLAAGVASHALEFHQGSHPLMYYIVWDMFCGWSAHSYRNHVIAEGESGTWYEVGTGPWEEARPFRPYGDLKRIHYDVNATHGARTALNVLRHTAHEPIVRIALVEEVWAKKFNLPEPHWSERWNVPKDPASYYAVRHVLSPNGQLLGSRPSWASEVVQRNVQDRAKIRRFSPRSAPMLAGAGWNAPVAERRGPAGVVPASHSSELAD